MEIEAKFAVPDDSTFEKLLALESLGEYRIAPGSERRTTDRYLDTPGRDLLQGGHALRRRADQAGGPDLVTVKGLGGVRGAVHHRPEVEIVVPPDTPPENWPTSLPRDVVLKLAGDQPLVEFITLRQRRTAREVMRQNRRIAVLSLDRVEFADGATARELEIELTPPGDDTDLESLGELLRPYGLRPQPLSKFERALSLLDGGGKGGERSGRRGGRGDESANRVRRSSAEPPAEHTGSSRPSTATSATKPKAGKAISVRADDPMSEAGRKILRFHWNQALAHEAGTILGEDPEELHDMRVATRRQRSALRIVQPHLRGKAMRLVRDGLRALAGCLGAVRDLDVQLASARAHQATLVAAEAHAFQALLDDWSRRREAARIRMTEHLGGQAHALFKERYTALLDTQGAGARTGTAPRATLVAHVLPYEIWAHYGSLLSFERVLPVASEVSLHELRIWGKRLRYLLEFFREVLDPCVEKPIKSIVALQNHLGEIQDGVVTTGLVDDFLAGPVGAADPEAAAAVGRYREARKARMAELRNSLGERWRSLIDPAFRSCLSKATLAVSGATSRAES